MKLIGTQKPWFCKGYKFLVQTAIFNPHNLFPKIQSLRQGFGDGYARRRFGKNAQNPITDGVLEIEAKFIHGYCS